MNMSVVPASVRLSRAEEASRRFEKAKKARRDAAERRRNQEDTSKATSSFPSRGSVGSGGLNSNPWLRRTQATRPIAEPLAVTDAHIGGSPENSGMTKAGCMTITALLPVATAGRQRSLTSSAVQLAGRPGSAQRCDRAATNAERVTSSARSALVASALPTDGAEGDTDTAPLQPRPLLKAQAVYRCGESSHILLIPPIPPGAGLGMTCYIES